MQSATSSDTGRHDGQASVPEDQVPRKERWARDHPDAEFVPPCEHDPAWQVRWGAGQFEVKALNLADLMARLEKLDK